MGTRRNRFNARQFNKIKQVGNMSKDRNKFINKYLKYIRPYNTVSHKIWNSLNSEEKILKLDWNEATIEPSPLVIKKMQELINKGDFYNLYPNTYNEELLEKLRQQEQIEDENSEQHGCCCKKSIDFTKKDFIKRLSLLAVSLIGIILSFINFWELVGLKQLWFLDFAYLAVVINGYAIFKTAIIGLKHKKITSSLLVTVAMIASIILEYTVSENHGHSYIFAAGEIAFFMALGGLIEDWTIGKSRKGIERLLAMTPKTAMIKMGSNFEKIAISKLKIGDVVLVKPNEQIPVDGEIVKGDSSVDQSSVTGEFVPVDVKVGDKVYGATWNKQGVIEVKVTVEPKDMTVNKLINLVKEAEGQKAPISRLADRWASFIVPSSIILSILVGVVSYFAFGLSIAQALIRGTTILVVFCPCSLTLATPTAVAAGLGSAAYNGIMIKSGDAIERLAKVTAVAFDKTGTITTGKLNVEKVIAFENFAEEQVLMLAGSAEKYSEHPIGKAIYIHASKNLTLKEPVNTRSLVGVGITAKVDNKLVKVISYKEAKKDFPSDKNLSSIHDEVAKGYSIVVVIYGFKIIGAICLFDTIREDAKNILTLLKNKGYKSIMLTGDNKNSAEYVKSLVGVDEYVAELMPEDKLNCVIELKKQGQNICMVGDGVNDAPALAGADSSIAMGALGSDVAVETADVAIMNSDIRNVYNALHLSKNTLSTIKRNIAISMSINALSVALSFVGILTPVTGVLVHNFCSLFVVISSAFILKTRYIKPAKEVSAIKQSKKGKQKSGCEIDNNDNCNEYKNGKKLCKCGKQIYCTCKDGKCED